MYEYTIVGKHRNKCLPIGVSNYPEILKEKIKSSMYLNLSGHTLTTY